MSDDRYFTEENRVQQRDPDLNGDGRVGPVEAVRDAVYDCFQDGDNMCGTRLENEGRDAGEGIGDMIELRREVERQSSLRNIENLIPASVTVTMAQVTEASMEATNSSIDVREQTCRKLS